MNDPEKTPGPKRPGPEKMAATAHFDAGAAWNAATRLLRANRSVLPVLAGLFFFVPQVLLTALVPDVPADLEGEAAAQAALDIFADWFALIFAVTLVQAMGMIAIAALLADRTRPTVREAMGKALRMLPTYVAAAMVVIAGIGLFALMILLPLTIVMGEGGAAIALVPIFAAAVWVNVRTLVLVPVICAEGLRNPFDALKRTWALTTGRGARMLLVLVLFVIAALVISIITTVVPGSLLIAALGLDTGRAIVGLIEGAVSAALIMVWTALIVAIHAQIAR